MLQQGEYSKNRLIKHGGLENSLGIDTNVPAMGH